MDLVRIEDTLKGFHTRSLRRFCVAGDLVQYFGSFGESFLQFFLLYSEFNFSSEKLSWVCEDFLIYGGNWDMIGVFLRKIELGWCQIVKVRSFCVVLRDEAVLGFWL